MIPKIPNIWKIRVIKAQLEGDRLVNIKQQLKKVWVRKREESGELEDRRYDHMKNAYTILRNEYDRQMRHSADQASELQRAHVLLGRKDKDILDLLHELNETRLAFKQVADLLAWYEDVFADPPKREETSN
jgi:hypothetical protein